MPFLQFILLKDNPGREHPMTGVNEPRLRMKKSINNSKAGPERSNPDLTQKKMRKYQGA